jgi:hypothetical protein
MSVSLLTHLAGLLDPEFLHAFQGDFGLLDLYALHLTLGFPGRAFGDFTLGGWTTVLFLCDFFLFILVIHEIQTGEGCSCTR